MPKSPAPQSLKPFLPFEKGFTLIELMVVLLIVAVMLSVVGISLSSNEQQRLQTMAQKAQYFMQLACDQGAMRQKMILLEPSKTQLQAWIAQKLPAAQNIDPKTQTELMTESSERVLSSRLSQYQWQPLGEALQWDEALSVDWVLAKERLSGLGLQQDMELDAPLELESEGLKTQQAFVQKMAQGWRCWPSGQRDAGQLYFRLSSFEKEVNEKAVSEEAWRLSWDTWGRFELENTSSVD